MYLQQTQIDTLSKNTQTKYHLSNSLYNQRKHHPLFCFLHSPQSHRNPNKNPENQNQPQKTQKSTREHQNEKPYSQSIAGGHDEQTKNAPATWSVPVRRRAYKTHARIRVHCARHAERMPSAKRYCIVRDVPVPAVTLVDRISNADQIHNATKEKHHARPIQTMNIRIARVIQIVAKHWRVAATDSALIHAKMEIICAKEINDAKRDAIGRCACANPALW